MTIVLPVLGSPDGEPYVLDVYLGRALGFERPRDVRDLILAHSEELSVYGIMRRTAAQTGRRGRPSHVFHLNERQALLLCMFARTPKAADVRRAVIDTFAAWRNGTLKPYKPAPAPSPVGTPLGVEEFSLRQTADGAYLVTFTTRRFDVARLVTEACLAPLLA